MTLKTFVTYILERHIWESYSCFSLLVENSRVILKLVSNILSLERAFSDVLLHFIVILAIIVLIPVLVLVLVLLVLVLVLVLLLLLLLLLLLIIIIIIIIIIQYNIKSGTCTLMLFVLSSHVYNFYLREIGNALLKP